MSGSGKMSRNDLCFWRIKSVLILRILWLKHIALYDSTGPMCFADELFYKENVAFFECCSTWNVHYPPLYSLIIAPGFFFQNWYEVMIRING